MKFELCDEIFANGSDEFWRISTFKIGGIEAHWGVAEKQARNGIKKRPRSNSHRLRTSHPVAPTYSHS